MLPHRTEQCIQTTTNSKFRISILYIFYFLYNEKNYYVYVYDLLWLFVHASAVFEDPIYMRYETISICDSCLRNQRLTSWHILPLTSPSHPPSSSCLVFLQKWNFHNLSNQMFSFPLIVTNTIPALELFMSDEP